MGRGKLGGGGDLRGDQHGKGEGGVGRSRHRYLYLDEIQISVSRLAFVFYLS
jgi:hypothetical protein